MSDHDQRFKILLKTFLPEFFELFLPDWAGLFDFSQVEWLDKEVFPDPPSGQRRVLDLVAKLPTRRPLTVPPGKEETWLSLIHVEVEAADSLTAQRRRMHWYYANLRQSYELPVLPVAVYLRVGLNGLGTDSYRERFGSLEVLTFNYLYVGLPKLDALQYLERGNVLGIALAALMNMPKHRRAWLKAEALLRLAKSSLVEQHKFLLAECVQAYLDLDKADEREEFERLLASAPFQEVTKMGTTWFEQGLERGMQQGLERGMQQGEITGKRKAILKVLETRFGQLSQAAREQVENWPEEDLDGWIDRIVLAQSLAELGLQAQGENKQS